jgi:hypothetical protein
VALGKPNGIWAAPSSARSTSKFATTNNAVQAFSRACVTSSGSEQNFIAVVIVPLLVQQAMPVRRMIDDHHRAD